MWSPRLYRCGRGAVCPVSTVLGGRRGHLHPCTSSAGCCPLWMHTADGHGRDVILSRGEQGTCQCPFSVSFLSQPVPASRERGLEEMAAGHLQWALFSDSNDLGVLSPLRRRLLLLIGGQKRNPLVRRGDHTSWSAIQWTSLNMKSPSRAGRLDYQIIWARTHQPLSFRIIVNMYLE